MNNAALKLTEEPVSNGNKSADEFEEHLNALLEKWRGYKAGMKLQASLIEEMERSQELLWKALGFLT